MGDVFATTKLIRLDAGWNLPIDLPLLPVPAPPPNYEFFISTFESKSLNPLIQKVGQGGLNERNVYRFMFLNGEKGGMNWEVSRHQFHCFLRWVSQSGNWFEMRRDGGLIIIQTEARGQRGSGGGNASGSRRGGAGGRGGSAGPRGSGGGAGEGRSEWNGRGDEAVSNQGTTWTEFINQ
ncbi:hypothetical protein N431DRAFT_425766 [Stipitochalara longipes BDJ]|nr:hypothetical protein N431DRAFT_425766 [Stipitochalara longipes BDJ]